MARGLRRNFCLHDQLTYILHCTRRVNIVNNTLSEFCACVIRYLPGRFQHRSHTSSSRGCREPERRARVENFQPA